MNNSKLLRQTYYYLLFSFLILVSACQEDEVAPTPGSPPTVNAGTDISGTVNSTVTLTGTASDPDGDALTTNWSITTRPDGSSASVTNASSLNASFTPDVAGSYTVQLSADDGNFDPVTDEVVVTVEENQGEPPVPMIVAEDGRAISEENENNTVTINTGYLLDGSGTTDPDTEVANLSFTWEITGTPDGSESASIEPDADNPDMATLVPDAVGEYTIQLTVADPEENSASVEVTIVADASPVIIDQNITEATTWPNIFEDPSLPDYLVVTDVAVQEELIVSPGVKVIFEPNRGMTIQGNDGILSAIGTADSMIVFTAEDTLNGWDGFFFENENVQNSFDYADISYGGQRDFGLGVLAAAIGVEASGGFSISNSSVTNSFNYGIYIENGGVLSAFEGNTLANNDNHAVGLPLNQVGSLDEVSTFTDNTDNSVEILGTALSSDLEMTILPLSNSTPYHVTGKLDVDGGLTVMPGAIFEMDPDAYFDIAGAGSGYITAEGTEADSIIFTARSMPDGWGGFFYANSTNARNSLAYARISYGGNRSFGLGVQSANIGVEASSRMKIVHSSITHSVGSYGIFVEERGEISEFTQNSFRNNKELPIGLPISTAGVLDALSTFSGNGDNSVEIFNSDLRATDAPQTLPAFADNTPYYISGKLDVDNHLTIKPGARLEFFLDVVMDVAGNQGALTAVGTADSVITFTAKNQADGWLGIFVNNNLSSNKLDYASVSYAGRGGFGLGVEAANVGVENNGKIAITNSSFTNSLGYGIFVEQNLGSITDQNGNQYTTNQEVLDAGNTFENNTSGDTNL